jgi:hypothetical protein
MKRLEFVEREGGREAIVMNKAQYPSAAKISTSRGILPSSHSFAM